MTDEQLAAMQQVTGPIPSQSRQGSSARTSCNSITPISRSGLRMRPHRYQGALRSWDAFMSANNKTWRMAASTNDVTLIGVMQGINVTSNAFDSSREDTPWGRWKLKKDAPP